MKVMKAAIIGGTGYGGLELIRLIHNHKYLTVSHVVSSSQPGEKLEEMYPHAATFLKGDMKEFDAKVLEKEADVVFFATPAGVSKTYIPELKNVQCVDLSGDLRLQSRHDYEVWYGGEAAPQKTLDEAVYGLTEVYYEELKQARICSNPGCYPTASLLGLIPAVQHGLIKSEGVIIDGKTGVSGAGRKQSLMTHFSETNDNVSPYKIGRHQHIPEIEDYLSKAADNRSPITMTTHLLPMTRGLMCTMYGTLKKTISTEEVVEVYKAYYETHPFVRVRPAGTFPSTKEVAGSNFCDIGLYVNEQTEQLTIVSVIDNLVKGAAGQAIQNVNVMNGWDVKEGLDLIPVYP